jgi:hypothetical protein
MDARRRGARHRRSGAAALAGALLVVAVVAGAAPAGAARPPAEWDTRLVPIVQQVERLRGLSFEHPVAVRFLADAAFTEKVTVDRGELTDSDAKQFERTEASLRAAGLVGGDVDLVGSLSDLQASGVLAYYEPDNRTVTVRGKALDVPTRVTVAHELTHALQDQHFDLARIRKAARRTHSQAAARALIEGDAKRVEMAYLDTLSDEEHAEYTAWQRETGERVDDSLAADGVPTALVALFQSPYLLGQEMLRLLVAGREEGAVDTLFEDPSLSDVSYLDPRTLLDERRVREVATPALAPGEERLGPREDVFGAFALYLLLATSTDPVDALRVADGWGGDALVTFTRAGTTCIRTTFVGAGTPESAAIADALRAWAGARGGGAAEVATDGEETTLTACDPGDATVDPGNAPTAALVTVVVRNTLLAQGAEQVGVESASCAVDRTLRDASFGPVIEAAVAAPTAPLSSAVSGPFTRALTTAMRDCSNG